LSLVLMLSAGCAYKNQYTFSATRKLLDSDAPTATKAVFAPLVCLGEGVWAPVASYIDAKRDAKDADHVYLSYIGTRTLIGQDLNPIFKFVGGIFVATVDTIWFPIGGTMDTYYALTQPTGIPAPATTYNPVPDTAPDKPKKSDGGAADK
jgi:hypothetical protein